MKQLISFVIPAKDEEGSVTQLFDKIKQQMTVLDQDFEVIFVDDGSTDSTYDILKNLHQQDKRVKIIHLRGNFGKSTALQVGFQHCKGEIIFTMDADLQDNPSEIPAFLAKLDQGFDLVSGWKKKRYDPLSKVLPSLIFNFITRTLTGIQIHDTNCGFKAYRRQVINNLNLYGEQYRFIPIVAAKQNFKVSEIVVDHQPRAHGKTKYGWERNIKGLLDLITIVFLTGYLKRPGHFFGTVGLAFFSIGFIIGLYIAYLRVTTGGIDYRYPLLFLGMLLMIVGIQFISTGLLAEITVHYNQKLEIQNVVDEIID